MDLIIYPSDNGGLVLCIPASCSLTIQEIARKDVPVGKPYLFVENSMVPENHLFFEAWEADFTNPDGHGIGADAWFVEQTAKDEEVTSDNN